MWDKDEPTTLSYEQWREREKRAARRSLIVSLIMALVFAGGLIYVFGGGA